MLSLLPQDADVARPIAFMQVGNRPEGYRSAQQRGVVAMIESGGHARSDQCEAVERFAFYERVRAAFAIVLTGEAQPYGNFLFRKGVLAQALVD